MPVNVFQSHKRGKLERTTCLVFSDHNCETFNHICSHFVVLCYMMYIGMLLYIILAIFLCVVPELLQTGGWGGANLDCLTLEDGTNTLSQNISKQLPTYTTQHVQSTTSQRKPKILHRPTLLSAHKHLRTKQISSTVPGF